MVRHVTKQPRSASGLRGNQFHRCHHSRLELVQAASQLDSLLSAAPEEGFRERPLLEWFGAATERMALLAHAGGHVYPTHVAKELILDNMRADFAVLSVPDFEDAAPRLLLVECQGARVNTLFEQRGRQLTHWGMDFLEGFGQLVDWDCFSDSAGRNQRVASLVAHCRRPLEVSYLLVAGLRKFSMDPISVERLHFWSKTLRLGAHFQIRRFDDVAVDAQNWIQQALWVGPTVEGARRDSEDLPSIERAFPPARGRGALNLL